MIEYELRYKKNWKWGEWKKVHVWEKPNQCIKNFESEVKGKKKKKQNKTERWSQRVREASFRGK